MLPAVLADAFVAAPRKAPKGLVDYWNAMLALAEFTTRDVLDRAGLGHDRNAHLVDYLSRLKRAGIVVETGTRANGKRGRQPVYRLARRDTAPPQVQSSGANWALDSTIAVVIPRSEDGAWAAICALMRAGGEFTCEAVDAAMQGAIGLDAVGEYVRRLARAGIAEMIGVASWNGRVVKAWRLLRQPAETPRLTQDGRPLQHAAQTDAMWKVMQMLGYFTAAELALEASTDEVAVPPGFAAEYAAHLAEAGYLLRHQRGDGSNVYKLHRYTGAMAPRLLRASFVFDANQNRIYGPGQRVREVRR